MIADPQLFIGLLSQRLVQLICPHCRRPRHEVATERTDDERRWWKASATRTRYICEIMKAARTAGVA